MLQQVRGAFEKLYSFLAGELESAAQQGDTPLQFALMDAWGVEVHEDDHDLLARVRIFNILQVSVEHERTTCSRRSGWRGRSCTSNTMVCGEREMYTPLTVQDLGKPSNLSRRHGSVPSWERFFFTACSTNCNSGEVFETSEGILYCLADVKK